MPSIRSRWAGGISWMSFAGRRKVLAGFLQPSWRGAGHSLGQAVRRQRVRLPA
jgi:hypothetical protein